MSDTPSIQPLRVMVVDDERGIREGSERILSRMGCETVTASRGEEGLERLSEGPIDIVLLDLKMPGMDGMEVLARVREIHPATLVIVITGFATVETAIEAMKQGAYDFIPKPFEPDQLRIVVNRAQETIRLRLEAEHLAAERARTLLDLDREKSRLRTIVESLPNGVVVTNTDGVVVLMNSAFRWHLGISADVTVGAPIDRYVPDEGCCTLAQAISRGDTSSPDDPADCEFSLADDKYLLARGRPVLDADGQCQGAVITVVDITDMKVLDQLKSEFVATVSHELRSPLSTIHEQLALVLRESAAREEEKDNYLLSRAKEKTQGLISLIGDMLDLTRIESGAVCTEVQAVQIDDLLGNMVDFLTERANAKQQSLTLERTGTPFAPITADLMALESIFGNLITNALIYTPENGHVTITAGMENTEIVVTVADTGFGIEPDHLPKIFDKFYRVKNARTRFITGTGLGLSIVKTLVDGLNGDISVASTPGEGTAFTVRLPTGE